MWSRPLVRNASFTSPKHKAYKDAWLLDRKQEKYMYLAVQVWDR